MTRLEETASNGALTVKLDININFNYVDRATPLLEKVLRTLEQMRDQMSESFDALTAEVDAAVTVEQGAVTALDALIVEVQALGDAPSPDQMQALVAKLQAGKTQLAAAIANVPPSGPAPVVISIAPASVTGQSGASVTGSFSATGGEGPYTYVADDQWPADLSLNPQGSYNGTPVNPETATSVVTATDIHGNSGTVTVAITIS